ncbi:MAG: hypothetical protein Q4G50_01995 [Corynebacterium sp.]|uniref:hypothetical protein n=1 Tax=Corynebacterium sp. TaxID=1720 RepID=UPI0026DEA6D1|nr:hypothetical protein [Corynebacterium sp.]MDO5668754.1 hypothetical protein [Corynebacterium sp.]
MRLPTTQQSVLFVFILVAISLGTWISGLFPAPQSVLDRPYLRTGSAERIGTVTVSDVAAHEVYREQPTQGIFLVVTLQATDVPEPLTLDATLIDGAGRDVQRHSMSQCGIQQPGLEFPCILAFEMDPTALAGSTLHIARDNVLAEREFIVADLDALLEEVL